MYTGTDVVFRVNPKIDTEQMDKLRAEGFDGHVPGHDWSSQLERSLLWIGAFHKERLVGFVNLAWDGGVHAFMLDTAVSLDMRRRGIGTRLVREAIEAARRHRGVEWVHVDTDEMLMRDFYEPAGFTPTPAGLVNVGGRPPRSEFVHTEVRRAGDVVVRSPKPWTPSVHALLRHLEDVGFSGAPRVVGTGFDDDGNETLTWIEGDMPRHGMDTIDAAAALGSLLRNLHDATATFRPPGDASWMPNAGAEIGRPSVIGHRDLGFWNIVLREGLPVAFIDWDFAGPVDPRVEVAVAAMLNANLYSDDIIEMHELPSLDVRCRQYRALVDAYGLSGADREGLVDLMIESLVRDMDANTVEADVRPTTKESDALWSLTWKSRTAAWLYRNRRTLDEALA